jgi:hypothetical protein
MVFTVVFDQNLSVVTGLGGRRYGESDGALARLKVMWMADGRWF